MNNISPVYHEIENFLSITDKYVNRSELKSWIECGSRDLEHAISINHCINDTKIISFECNPFCVDLCKARLDKYFQETSKTNIYLFERAVFTEDNKNIEFYPVDMVNSPSKNHGSSSIYKLNPEYYSQEPILQEEKPISVQTIRVDTSLKALNIKELNACFIDLQGAELLFLKSLGDFLKDVKVMQLELEHLSQYEGQALKDEVVEFLKPTHSIVHCNGTNKYFGEYVAVRNDLVK